MHFYVFEGISRSAYDCVLAKESPCFCYRHVFLAQVYAVGSKHANQFYMVVDDERRAVSVAKLPYLPADTKEVGIRRLLHAQLLRLLLKAHLPRADRDGAGGNQNDFISQILYI